jgi:hypothetical protein
MAAHQRHHHLPQQQQQQPTPGGMLRDRGSAASMMDPSLPDLSMGMEGSEMPAMFQSSMRRPRRSSTQADMSGFLGETSLGDDGAADQSTASAGRTLKDRDQLISDLKKENFNLKLRIYYMEDQMRQIDKEGTLRLQVDLRVEVDRLQHELRDKDELLLKAATSLDDIASSYEVGAEHSDDDQCKA